nr:CopD family protein [Brachybacterium equifaecis]
MLAAGLAVLAAQAAGAGNTVLLNAGAIARRGAPIASLLADLGGALTLGAAVLGGWILRRDADRVRALGLAAITAGIWTLAQLASLLLSYALATGQPVGDPRFGSDLHVYLGTELGLWLLAGTVLAAGTTTVAVLGSSRRLARILTVMATLTLFAKAMTGHASGASAHEAATSTMLVHLLAVGAWAGALGVLQLLPVGARGSVSAAADGPRADHTAGGTRGGAAHGVADRDDAAVVRGYSHLALISWIALAVSGVWALALRMNTPAEILTSPYVQLGVAKAVLLLVLGMIGWQQRRVLADAAAVSTGGGAGLGLYRRLALLELGLMTIAIALAAAMSSSPPPADATPVPGSIAELLTGYPMPPAPSFGAVLGSWRVDAFALAAAAALVLVWWRPASPRRERWASALLLAGVALALLVTCGPLAVYAKVLASAHLIEHVLLFAVAGPLIGAAFAPPRILAGVCARSRWLLPVLSVVPVALLAAAYAYPPLLRAAMEGHVMHLVLMVGAAVLGAVQVWISAAARRDMAVGPVTAVLAVALPAAGLLACGIVLILGDTALLPSWFGATGRTWRADTLADQRDAGWVIAGLAVVQGLVLAWCARGGSTTGSPR